MWVDKKHFVVHSYFVLLSRDFCLNIVYLILFVYFICHLELKCTESSIKIIFKNDTGETMNNDPDRQSTPGHLST